MAPRYFLLKSNHVIAFQRSSLEIPNSFHTCSTKVTRSVSLVSSRIVLHLVVLAIFDGLISPILWSPYCHFKSLLVFRKCTSKSALTATLMVLYEHATSNP